SKAAALIKTSGVREAPVSTQPPDSSVVFGRQRTLRSAAVSEPIESAFEALVAVSAVVAESAVVAVAAFLTFGTGPRLDSSTCLPVSESRTIVPAGWVPGLTDAPLISFESLAGA